MKLGYWFFWCGDMEHAGKLEYRMAWHRFLRDEERLFFIAFKKPAISVAQGQRGEEPKHARAKPANTLQNPHLNLLLTLALQLMLLPT